MNLSRVDNKWQERVCIHLNIHRCSSGPRKRLLLGTSLVLWSALLASRTGGTIGDLVINAAIYRPSDSHVSISWWLLSPKSWWKCWLAIGFNVRFLYRESQRTTPCYPASSQPRCRFRRQFSRCPSSCCLHDSADAQVLVSEDAITFVLWSQPPTSRWRLSHLLPHRVTLNIVNDNLLSPVSCSPRLSSSVTDAVLLYYYL